jgi:hypothetical protein
MTRCLFDEFRDGRVNPKVAAFGLAIAIFRRFSRKKSRVHACRARDRSRPDNRAFAIERSRTIEQKHRPVPSIGAGPKPA